jgi:predicted acylesterase/phospholipase RssA
VLTGWTKAGTRPDFDVVTGISTGALMATHVFLGSEFDEDLEMYKEVSNRDIFRKRGFARALQSDAVYDTMPLRRLLSSMITEELLDRVAAEHQTGRRLFIGTTNLDADTFTIWDMGMIARSTRPDRRKRYIEVVLASASFPIAFPPVYIDVEGESGSYTQMHADGGIRETVFFFDFLEELEAALAAADLQKSDIQQDLYLLINGDFTAVDSKEYKPIEGKLGAVAGATITSMMNEIPQGSVLRLWILAMADGADFHLAFVPPSFEFKSHPLSFDPVQGQALYDLGYSKAVEGTAWATQRAPTTTEEFVENVIRGVTTFDRSETPEWLEPEDKH